MIRYFLIDDKFLLDQLADFTILKQYNSKSGREIYYLFMFPSDCLFFFMTVT